MAGDIVVQDLVYTRMCDCVLFLELKYKISSVEEHFRR
jgi:hypothetical protein